VNLGAEFLVLEKTNNEKRKSMIFHHKSTIFNFSNLQLL